MIKLFILMISLIICPCFIVPNHVALKSVSIGDSSIDRLNGTWKATLDLGDAKLPFIFKIDQSGQLTICNASEILVADDVKIAGDAITITLPFFNSEINAMILSDSMMVGKWHDHSRGSNYALGFTAISNSEDCFKTETEPASNVDGTWKVTFSPNSEGTTPAVGVFSQEGSTLTGTFLTETGDYRFLEGIVSSNQIKLSTFDGAHAFLFSADIRKDSLVNGMFYSGNHWKEPWVAVRDTSFKLQNPDSLTFLKEGFDRLAFSFPNLDNKMVSLEDEAYENKVVIVQIMGSWCPNCMDETRLFAEYYKEWNKEGLEIIGLAFERSEDFNESVKNVQKFKQGLDAEYDFLIAGKSSKKAAGEALPMLNKVMSYPTSIFIDRKGNIRRIHTGFYGPGTGHHYVTFKSETEQLIKSMLKE